MSENLMNPCLIRVSGVRSLSKGIVQGEDLGMTHSVTLSADGNRWGFKISFGNDGAHNNLTPSTATYIWRRSS